MGLTEIERAFIADRIDGALAVMPPVRLADLNGRFRLRMLSARLRRENGWDLEIDDVCPPSSRYPERSAEP